MKSCNVFIGMFLTFPRFNKMKNSREGELSDKVIPKAAGLYTNGRNKLLEGPG